MARFLTVYAIVILATYCFNANAQFKNDSLCYHKLKKSEKGNYLSWYKPEIPGAGFDQVVKLSSAFIKSGVPNEPKTGLPLYMLFCEFFGSKMSKEFSKGLSGNYGAPNNPACTYAGFVQSLAVDFRVYSGDTSYIGIVRRCLDHQLTYGTTPSNWIWPNCPYASADAGEIVYKGALKGAAEGGGDGLYILEPDKIGELGVGYAKFYQITGEERFLRAALNCADALSKNINQSFGSELKNNIFISNLPSSPWPFRVSAKTGSELENYCSNVIEPIRLFDELIRISEKITLAKETIIRYKIAKKIAWDWLFSLEGPMKTAVWKGYFEDVKRDPFNQNRIQVTPLETARYFLINPDSSAYSKEHANALVNWVASVFGTDGVYNMPAINEQLWCFQPMGSHTARYASICALLYEQTGSVEWKQKAFEYFNWATYCCDHDGYVATGPFWEAAWFTDGYGDYIKHFIEGMAAVPEWAPAGENHLLKSTSVVQNIKYTPKNITYKTYDESAKEVLRLAAKPGTILVNGNLIKEIKNENNEGWVWQSLAVGGVCRINHSKGAEVVINFAAKK